MTRTIALCGWVAVVALLLACPLLAWRKSLGLAGLRQLIGVLTGARWRRAAVLLGWMWIGWHFFVR